MRMSAIAFLLLFIGSIGCSEKDSGTPLTQPNPPPSAKPEPLPTLPICEDLVEVHLQTAATPLAISRKIQIGYRQGFYFAKYELDKGEVRPALWLDRGLNYYIEMQTLHLDRSRDYSNTVIYVPKCKEREEYQKMNRTYEEPIRLAK